MSGSNNSAPPLPEITLAELERLIRLLGMLGSEHDGEVLAAARFAQRWVREAGTDWKTLLTPPEEALPVLGVAAPEDPEALAKAAEIERVEAFQRGFQAGVQDAMAKVKAQAQALHAAGQPVGSLGAVWASLGGGLGGSGVQQASNTGSAFQPAQAASQGPGRPITSPGGWRNVCQELLDRQGQGIPGVFRGPKEEAFVRDVLKRGFPTLTTAQDTWLRDIAARNGLSW